MPSPAHTARRSGFALVAVLWVIASAAVIGARLITSAHESVAIAQNSVDFLRAFWRAEGCAEAARSLIDESLANTDGQPKASGSWTNVPATLSTSGLTASCVFSVRPGGTTLDVNTTDTIRIRNLLVASGQTPDRADSLLGALLDWRDEDDSTRPLGAERAWYTERGRPSPRNGAIASLDELRLVRGFDELGGLDTLFGLDDERIYLAAAPLAVLASLPGFSPGVLANISDCRSRGVAVGDLTSLVAAMSPSNRALLLEHYPELLRLTTAVPESWTIRSNAAVGAPPLTATVELRLVLAGSRSAIVRRRSW